MGKLPRRPGQGASANRLYGGVTSWGAQVRALGAMPGTPRSRVLTSSGSSGQWSPTEIRAGGSGVPPMTQSGKVPSSAPPGEESGQPRVDRERACREPPGYT